jgi:hypothetical protein
VAKPRDKQPWFKFYPQDWRGDAKLRTCSIAARGLWAEMLCVMHEADPYGYLLINGRAVNPKQLAVLAGVAQSECMRLMVELAGAGVYSVDETNRIYSRRMVRDKAKADKDRENGRCGGNPKLKDPDKAGVNPSRNGEDKAHIPNPNSTTKATSAAPVVLSEAQEKQALALRVMLAAIRSSKNLPIPNLDQINIWIADGISPNTISAACAPLLNRKEDMASLAYCDSAVRAAHGLTPHLQVVSQRVWVDEGTPEWSSHQTIAHERTGRGTPVTDQRDSDGRLTGRRGWYFATLWAEGFNDFGERIRASSEENAA